MDGCPAAGARRADVTGRTAYGALVGGATVLAAGVLGAGAAGAGVLEKKPMITTVAMTVKASTMTKIKVVFVFPLSVATTVVLFSEAMSLLLVLESASVARADALHP
jgi:hypothetical protein